MNIATGTASTWYGAELRAEDVLTAGDLARLAAVAAGTTMDAINDGEDRA